MPYEKKLWQDRIKDAQGNIIQEGTPFSAGNMNRIEQGIYDAHQELEKQSCKLSFYLRIKSLLFCKFLRDVLLPFSERVC
jgi:hypothetical protein